MPPLSTAFRIFSPQISPRLKAKRGSFRLFHFGSVRSAHANNYLEAAV